MNKIVLTLIASAVFVSCNNESARYTDLKTGESIKPVKDEATGAMVDEETKKPVYIYVDHVENDTIFGRTGKSIKGKVLKSSSGEYTYSGDVNGTDGNGTDVQGEMKIKDGDYKMKVDKDGDVKIKTDDKTIKIDGETGEKKVKD